MAALVGASINHRVMPGFMPGIHAFAACPESKAWMAATSAAMTGFESLRQARP